MVDEPRVRRLLQRVGDDLALLTERARVNRKELASDVDRLAAVKYFFVTAIEGCVDVAHHLCASESWAPPASNADAFRVLARHEVIAHGLAESMGRAAGFRNLLVHEYATIDDQIVVANLDRLGDLDDFINGIVRWIEG
jgi:uncharacterized protein YutE (UPF0331/DUF86 family)